MRISVVIPAYNEEKYIGACLESLMKQTKKPFEILVVDNNSTDNTAKIARSFDGVDVINAKVQGITPTRNAGFNAAKGDIIARTDADTLVPEDWIEQIEHHMQDEDIIAISGRAFLGTGAFYLFITKVQEFIFFKISELILKHTALYGPNLALRRTSWIKVRDSLCTNDRQFHEDLDLAIHLSKLGIIRYIPTLKVQTSSRRIRSDIFSLLFDYNIRYWKTIFGKHGLN